MFYCEAFRNSNQSKYAKQSERMTREMVANINPSDMVFTFTQKHSIINEDGSELEIDTDLFWQFERILSNEWKKTFNKLSLIQLGWIQFIHRWYVIYEVLTEVCISFCHTSHNTRSIGCKICCKFVTTLKQYLTTVDCNQPWCFHKQISMLIEFFKQIHHFFEVNIGWMK